MATFKVKLKCLQCSRGDSLVIPETKTKDTEIYCSNCGYNNPWMKLQMAGVLRAKNEASVFFANNVKKLEDGIHIDGKIDEDKIN